MQLTLVWCMNPTKRAKLETDLNKEISGLINQVSDLLNSRILWCVSDAGKSDQTGLPLTPSSIKSSLEEADEKILMIEKKVLSFVGSDSKLPAGTTLRISLSPLISLLLLMLRIQPSSARSDKSTPADFKNLLSSLPLIHRWTFDNILKTAKLAGPLAIAPFTSDFCQILEHFLKTSADGEIEINLISWMWSDECYVLSEAKKYLGKKVASNLIKSMERAAKDGSISNSALLLAENILKDGVGCGVALPVLDTLFQQVIDVLFALCDKQDCTSEILISLIKCLVSGSISSIPSYLSPRAPLTIRLLTMISVSPRLPSDVLEACNAALSMVEAVIHPRRVLPPVEVSVKRRRVEAIVASFDESVAENILESKSTFTAVNNVPSFSMKFDSEKISSESASVERPFKLAKTEPSGVEIVEQISVETAEDISAQVVAAPNLLMCGNNFASTVEEDDDDEEPLPDLIL